VEFAQRPAVTQRDECALLINPLDQHRPAVGQVLHLVDQARIERLHRSPVPAQHGMGGMRRHRRAARVGQHRQ
jgi:hypothetical protein